MHQEDQDRLEEIKEDNMEAAKKQQSKSKNPTTEAADSQKWHGA